MFRTNYNKLIGAVVGMVLTYMAGQGILPPETVSTEAQGAITGVLGALLVWAVPAYKNR